MSEFACRQGHLMSSGDKFCQICGGRVHTMDGMTNSQLRRVEEAAEEEAEEEDSQEDEEFEEED